MMLADGVPGEDPPTQRGEPDRGPDRAFQQAFTWLRDPPPSRSPRFRAMPSAPASSWPWPATCGRRRRRAAFAMRETPLGLVPDLAGTHPLVDVVGTRGRWSCAPPVVGWPPRRRSAWAWPAGGARADLAGATADLVAALLTGTPAAPGDQGAARQRPERRRPSRPRRAAGPGRMQRNGCRRAVTVRCQRSAGRSAVGRVVPLMYAATGRDALLHPGPVGHRQRLEPGTVRRSSLRPALPGRSRLPGHHRGRRAAHGGRAAAPAAADRQRHQGPEHSWSSSWPCWSP